MVWPYDWLKCFIDISDFFFKYLSFILLVLGIVYTKASNLKKMKADVNADIF